MNYKVKFNMKLTKIIITGLFLLGINNFAGENESYISLEKSEGYFTLAETNKVPPLVVSPNDHAGVLRVVKHFQNDIKNVTGIEPDILNYDIPPANEIIIIGSIDKSPLIADLVEKGMINISGLVDKWESSLIQIIYNPYPGVERALIITGSDKRGTIYAMYDLSRQIGVSPWYWWADVPVKKKNNIYIKPGHYFTGEPKVKYRGIFINDEAPALSGWSIAKYGTELFNHELYEHVFELILRLRGNFLWPAMWGRAFYDDDPKNAKLANEYGVVISTSHHEPLMRAHVEWQRYGSGSWNYNNNEEKLNEFWREGIERMGENESVITLGMRGDGDEPMSDEADIALLEKIVADQREIIRDVTGKNIEEVPQVWALYKEVQEYYDKGMRVPDDVTLLLCDDNWGNIRTLPDLNEKKRKGGYGIYYHYDFVGGPRNYKWLNTTQISRVWEQMNLAYHYGTREIWIVNVGDLKPMEFPISFWLDYAWNPEAIKAEDLPNYTKRWAEEQFGSQYADITAHLIDEYTRFNSRRKPEMISPDTYSLINYREAERIVEDYKKLETEARKVYNSLPDEYKDSYYQLVLHPIEACANLNELYFATAKNWLYHKQGRALTNKYAERVKFLFERDAKITNYYNDTLASGKWKHMMDQTHIGYTSWQQPDDNIMPEVKTIDNPVKAEMGIVVEGSDKWWSEGKVEVQLPAIDNLNKQKRYFEIFNRGTTPFEYKIQVSENWLSVSSYEGMIEDEQRIFFDVNWEQVNYGKHSIPFTIKGPDESEVIIEAIVVKHEIKDLESRKGFFEGDGYISIEAPHYNQAIESDSTYWQIIPVLGRTSSSISPFPVTSKIDKPGENSPHLQYNLHFFNSGEFKIRVYLSPTLNFKHGDGLHYAVSFNDEKPQVVNIHENATVADWKYPQWWNEAVGNNIMIKTTTHKFDSPGDHILKLWMVDAGVVFQKIVIETTGIKPSYLGPPESYKQAVKNKVRK